MVIISLKVKIRFKITNYMYNLVVVCDFESYCVELYKSYQKKRNREMKCIFLMKKQSTGVHVMQELEGEERR